MARGINEANLGSFPGIDSFSPEGIAFLKKNTRLVTFTMPTQVLQKGVHVSGAYVVLEGRLRVFTTTTDGVEATLYNVNPGETCVFALNCIFKDVTYPANVTAAAATRVAVVPGVAYRSLFESESAIRDLTISAFSNAVFTLITELEETHSLNLEQRLAQLLLRNAESDGSVRITQQEIASHLGTSREVVARILRKLASKQYLSTARRLIRINPPPNSLHKLIKPDTYLDTYRS